MLWRQRIRGLTQRQLEKMADLPNGSVSRLERGNGMPTPEALQRIAHVLDVSANDLRWAAAGLLDHLSRGLGSGADALEEDAFDGLAESSGSHGTDIAMPGRLEHRWRRLRTNEAALHRERDRLEVETMLWIVHSAGTCGSS